MKEKFRGFFAKHRHLIVIALVFAIILAAVTPLVVPLGLEAEKRFAPSIAAPRFPKLQAHVFQSYTVHCYEHVNTEAALFRMDTEDEWTQTLGLDILCALLNKAPEGHCDQKEWETLCSISLAWKDESKVLYPRSGLYHLLQHPDGRYSLRGSDRHGRIAHWYISEESAQALLAYRRCETEPIQHQSPRAPLCSAENITACTLITWENRTKSTPLELSRNQIETLCIFLETQLLPAEYVQQYISITHGENGWQATLTVTDGTTWFVQYNDTQGCLSLSCRFSDGRKQNMAAGYSCIDEAAIAALPELILDAGQ